MEIKSKENQFEIQYFFYQYRLRRYRYMCMWDNTICVRLSKRKCYRDYRICKYDEHSIF